MLFSQTGQNCCPFLVFTIIHDEGGMILHIETYMYPIMPAINILLKYTSIYKGYLEVM